MKSNYKDYLEIVKDFLHKFLGIDFYFQTFPNFRYNNKGDKYPLYEIMIDTSITQRMK